MKVLVGIYVTAAITGILAIAYANHVINDIVDAAGVNVAQNDPVLLTVPNSGNNSDATDALQTVSGTNTYQNAGFTQ